MSAILSSDDLNDFISPGVACIKPVETLPAAPASNNAYEVTTEDQLHPPQQPAEISLTDCLACSGCVTSAEAVLISLQSHEEVLRALDSAPAYQLPDAVSAGSLQSATSLESNSVRPKLYVATISPQVCASLAATFRVSYREATWMLEQFLGGRNGLASGGKYGNRFTWIISSNVMRDVVLAAAADEMSNSAQRHETSKPILTSACPGWVCYAEKTHPHVLPHLSRVKSPQALTGTMFKTVLSAKLGINPDDVWHLAVMPCFDKKLEASRQELTSAAWEPQPSPLVGLTPIREVDCVITAKEILMLAKHRGLDLNAMPLGPLDTSPPFPDPYFRSFCLDASRSPQTPDAGTSGGYLLHVLKLQQANNPGSVIQSSRGRNADVVDYSVVQQGQTVFRAARYYGFRNIQNLVRKLKPASKSRMPIRRGLAPTPRSTAKGGEAELSYVEVMACPGGCTNGGGQIKLDDLSALPNAPQPSVDSSKAWLEQVDEAYFSMDESTTDSDSGVQHATDAAASQSGPTPDMIRTLIAHWSQCTGISAESLLLTSYRAVESDVGKTKTGNMERVTELAGKLGGGW